MLPGRLALLLSALLLSFAAFAAPAAAQEVPPALRGAWFGGDCADPDAMLVLTGRSAARLDMEEAGRLFRFTATRQAAGFTLGVGLGAEAPRLMFRAAGSGLETI
jgi:hypothetical protein